MPSRSAAQWHTGAQQLGAAQVGGQHGGASQLGGQHSTQHAGSQHFCRREQHRRSQPNSPQRRLGASQQVVGQQQQSGGGAQQLGGGQQQLGGGAQQLGAGAQQLGGSQHGAGAQQAGAQQVGSGQCRFRQQSNRPASAALMLDKSTTTAVRVVNFILRVS